MNNTKRMSFCHFDVTVSDYKNMGVGTSPLYCKTYVFLVVNYIINNMFYLYILKSKKDGSLYTGSTNNLRRRLFEHNNGESTYTKVHKPFELKYYEAYFDESEARKRESSLKNDGRALYVLKKRISKSLQ